MTDQSHQCVIIGIAGASASGKSLIASTLYRELREQVGDVEHTRMKETVTVEPKKVIILEGILLLTDARLRDELNFSIFVDTPLDICLMRRIKRDVNERGRSMDSVMAQYQKTVRPMFLQFIEPSKQYADIIVPRGGKNRIAIDILKAKISQFFE